MGVEPQRSRPEMPAGYGVPESDEGMLDWSWAVDRLELALNYWFGTTCPDGRPHVMPGWAVWLDDELYFEGSPRTRRARNLASNAAVAATDWVDPMSAATCELFGLRTLGSLLALLSRFAAGWNCPASPVLALPQFPGGMAAGTLAEITRRLT